MYSRARTTYEGDAYDLVGVSTEHRPVVKEAFNAMVRATSQLNQKPKDIDLLKVGLSWPELKQLTLDRHEPIANQFFCSLGNELQFQDSRVAEHVMLKFVEIGVPCLPIHDSFIIHHGYHDMLQDTMNEAFMSVFNVSVNIKLEEKTPRPVGDGKPISLDVNDLLDGEPGYSQYTKRLNAFDHWRSHQ